MTGKEGGNEGLYLQSKSGGIVKLGRYNDGRYSMQYLPDAGIA
jgi:hypothetical protein